MTPNSLFNLNYYNKSIAIYIHWPYCLSKCPYCDFNSYILPSDNTLTKHNIVNEIEVGKDKRRESTIHTRRVTSDKINNFKVADYMQKNANQHTSTQADNATSVKSNNYIDYDTWLNAYLQEINYFHSIIVGKYIKSIFFGGGTPSLMPVKIVESIINQLGKIGIIDNQTEITLETNPTSFETEKFMLLHNVGVNRVSIGVQSLINKDLVLLGRNHDTKDAINAVTEAKKIFNNVSFDLIYARSGQTLAEWKNELTEALLLAQNHLSLYQLTIEKGTNFYQKHLRGELNLPTENVSSDMYEWTNEYLISNNFNRYEISNYAKKGSESKHNLAYWHYESFIGIGPGAHSRVHYQDIVNSVEFEHYGTRNKRMLCRQTTSKDLHKFKSIHYNDKLSVENIVMHRTPHDWISAVLKQGHGIQTRKILSSEEVTLEMLMMGLRLAKGINVNRFEKIAGMQLNDIINHDMLDLYKQHHFLELSDDNLKLTDKGLMLHNYIVPRLVKIIV